MKKIIALTATLSLTLLTACNASVTDNTPSDTMSSASSVMMMGEISSTDATMDTSGSGAEVDAGTGAVLDTTGEELSSEDSGVYEDPADNARD